MLTMLRSVAMFRTITLAVLFVLTATLSVLGIGSAAHADESTPRCTAYVDVYEDGTWDGSVVLNADGTHLADHWEPSADGWHLDAYGRWSLGMAFGLEAPCDVRDGRELWAGSDSTAMAPCVASVDILEDGTWAGGQLTSHEVHVASSWSVGGPDAQGTVIDDHAVTDFVPTWAGSFCSYGLTS